MHIYEIQGFIKDNKYISEVEEGKIISFDKTRVRFARDNSYIEVDMPVSCLNEYRTGMLELDSENHRISISTTDADKIEEYKENIRIKIIEYLTSKINEYNQALQCFEV